MGCLLGTACSASTRTAEVTDCNAASGYELSAPLRTFEVSNEDWFSGGDPTGSTTKPVIEAVSAQCSTGGSEGTAGTTSTGGPETQFWRQQGAECWESAINDPGFWQKMADATFISDEELWALRYRLRRELIEFARRHLPVAA